MHYPRIDLVLKGFLKILKVFSMISVQIHRTFKCGSAKVWVPKTGHIGSKTAPTGCYRPPKWGLQHPIKTDWKNRVWGLWVFDFDNT